MTRSKKLVGDEDEDIVALKEQVALKDTTDKKNDKVKDKRNQWREKQIIVNEKQIEGEKQREKEEKEKFEKQ